MGQCVLCGKPAGFLRRRHKDCEIKRVGAIAELTAEVTRCAAGVVSEEAVRRALQSARDSRVSESDTRQALVRGWEGAVSAALDDGLLDEAEETRLVQLQRFLGLEQAELDQSGSYSKVAKAGALRELMHGSIPSRIRLDGQLAFNFQKSEQLVWAFQEVEYLEDKTRREYVGGSHGVSLRIAKGVYYRVGAFRGTAIDRTERQTIDRGTLAVTTKHLYFGGASKSFRIRHDKIVSYMPFGDGVGVVRDAASAKPQIFVTGDGWFTYNLIANVARLG